MGDSEVFRWLLDIGHIWPNPEGEYQQSRLTTGWGATSAAKRALNLLPSEEREKALRFYRPKDARLSLGSNLLKHLAIVRTCDVPWKESIVGEDVNRKPCYAPVGFATTRVEFNVSHHGTLVALVGCSGTDLKLGVDIVQMNWEKDYAAVLKDGFEHWANIYEAVFSDQEVADIAHYDTGLKNREDDIRAKLRHFYAHWCLKEAYVKMTGEALMAPWLKDLEFKNVEVPPPVKQNGSSLSNIHWGQTCDGVEILFRGVKISDVRMELQAYGQDYMIGTATSTTKVALQPFQHIDLERDVYTAARDA